MVYVSRLVKTIAFVFLTAGCISYAAADEIKVLSAGAIEPGLKAVAAAFKQQTGHATHITFHTAPELKKQMEGESANLKFDVVIAPPAVIEGFAAANKLAETRANVGRVGMGVAVRDGARVPDISNAVAFKRSVLDAESLVFNRASTGLYLEELLKKTNLYAQVENKTTRYPDGAAVMEHVIKSQGYAIGFGALTEILLYQHKGLKLVGPVPPELQNYTTYIAAPLAASKQQALAQEFVSFLSGPIGKPLWVAAGVTN